MKQDREDEQENKPKTAGQAEQQENPRINVY